MTLTTTRNIAVFMGTRPGAIQARSMVTVLRVSAMEWFSPEALFEFA